MEAFSESVNKLVSGYISGNVLILKEGLACSDREFLDAYQISPRCIGDSNFISHVDKLYCEISDKYTSPEDVTFRRVVEPLQPSSTHFLYLSS